MCWGYGVVATHARVAVSRTLVHRNTALGIGVNEGANVTLEDSVVQGTLAPTGRRATGVRVSTQSTLNASRTLVRDNASNGVYVENLGTTVNLSDISIESHPQIALVVDEGRVTANRLVIQSDVQVGALVWKRGASLTGRDVLIGDFSPSATGVDSGEYLNGVGVDSLEGGTVQLDRIAVEGIAGVGFASVPFYGVSDGGLPEIHGGSRIEVQDALIRNIRPFQIRAAVPYSYSMGLNVAEDCVLTFRRGVVLGGEWGYVRYYRGTINLSQSIFSDQERVGGFYRDVMAPSTAVPLRCLPPGSAYDPVMPGGVVRTPPPVPH